MGLSEGLRHSLESYLKKSAADLDERGAEITFRENEVEYELKRLETLENELIQARFALLVVSHDRAFLNRVTDTVHWLEGRKVKLLGLDIPSVDTIEAKVLVNHHALAAANIAIVESLDLNEVEAGTYHFSALPLRINGGDAAPVRAILWRD